MHRKFPLVSLILMLSGMLVILWVIWPIITFELMLVPKYKKMFASNSPAVASVEAKSISKGKILGFATIDYTKASNWFPATPQKPIFDIEIKNYKLNIPKLGIFNANVIIGGEDLSKALIQYGGTALPGNYGTTVVFGHSTLPAFFNPKDYLTIFSTLPTLEKGDKIIVTYDRVTYTYEIYNMKVIMPDDFSVLGQQKEWSYISLITCVPPGTYWKRLVVQGKLLSL